MSDTVIVDPMLMKIASWRNMQNLILQIYVDAWLTGDREGLVYTTDHGSDFPKKLYHEGVVVGEFRMLKGSYQLDWIRSLDDLERMDRIGQSRLQQED